MNAPSTLDLLAGVPDQLRLELIDICKTAIVPHAKWHDRDSSSAQRKVGECFVLLSAGCPFSIRTEGDPKSDAHTIWLDICFTGFEKFEDGEGMQEELFYLPTRKRLEEAKGGDWY